MIAQLRGRVAAKSLSQMVIDVGGVGYAIHVAPGTITASVGDEATVHTHLAVREDALTLYGFADAGARQLFETLLSVSGVGPKLALTAIGTLGATGLRQAVIAEDISALTAIPGVGKKGAQRMVLELRSKLGSLDDSTLPAADGRQAAGETRAEVRQALAALGYGPAEVREVMDALDPDADAPADELLRHALRGLAGGPRNNPAGGQGRNLAGGRGSDLAGAR